MAEKTDKLMEILLKLEAEQTSPSKAHTAITALQNQAIASTLDRVEVEVIGADEGMARWPFGKLLEIRDRSYKQSAESPAPSHHQYTEGAEVSRATAKVKFPDGTIKYGIYNGTVDFYWSPLFDMSDEAWQAWHEYCTIANFDTAKWDAREPLDAEEYDVEIADDYGYGHTYSGRATKWGIKSSLDIGIMDHVQRGLPEWWFSKTLPPCLDPKCYHWDDFDSPEEDELVHLHEHG